ncbi:hypothetical protein [Arthrobacter castelli]|uniref:hypothetical protein n=1 Tax=Arthrobacter castelli TaxID=271431 RepID=UPI0003FFE78E|nr:hypothetical protein [Arthrobacter castelli]
MTSTFDTRLTEVSLVAHNSLIHMYKVGGGTVGQRYAGRWGYRVIRCGETVACGADLHTHAPLSHQQVAQLALDIADTTGKDRQACS